VIKKLHAGMVVLGATLTLLVAAPLPAQSPSRTRKVVLEKVESGYRWKLIQSPVPAVGPRQVLVHVRAVGLNRGDLEVLEPDPRNDRSGRVVASDAAGDVVAIGKEVKGFSPGARVTTLYFRNWTEGPPNDQVLAQAHGASVDGVLGDYIVLDDTAVVAAPAGLSYEEAAALPTASLTAWMATVGRRDINRGDVVLVQGTGGVSIFALQFAAAAGARVIVTSSSDDKLKRAKAIGASDGINYQSVPAWSDRVLELTDRKGAAIVVDVGGKKTLEQSAKSLAYLGMLSIVGGLSGYGGAVPAMPLLLRSASAQGIYVGSRADYTRMSEFITAHKLHPVIDRVYPLDRYEDALRQMASNDFVGKIVLRL